MILSRLFNALGLGILALAFIVSLVRIATRAVEEADPSTIPIRVAHWQLEPGVREAIDVLARRYMAERAGIRIKQQVIPNRTYTTWVRTQLTSGTSPDLIQIGTGITEELLSRYFEPLGPFVRQPNPRNANGPLAELPWRETFIDGIASQNGFNPSLKEYYGIPNSMQTVRMYYNAPLWQEILGSRPTPTDYSEFIEICQAIQQHSRHPEKSVLPISASQYNAREIARALFSQQTQRLSLSINPSKTMRPDGIATAIAYLQGQWNMSTKAIHDGLQSLRDVGQFMQPGFLQLEREDAVFYFAQERAVMIPTGSWDTTSLRSQAAFEIGAFTIPTPSPEHPVYGPNVLGPLSEAGTDTAFSFGIAKQSSHKDIALDFLHFISTQENNQTFSNVSGWLPSVVGVQPPASIQPFYP